MSTPIKLDHVRIATQCPISWEQMTGDNRIRFCGHCQLNVYNLSELNRVEAEVLINSTEQRICAQLYRRSDGTVLTKDCPVGLRALRQRVSKTALAVFTIIGSLCLVAFGQSSGRRERDKSCIPQARVTRKVVASQSEALISGTVLDPVGAVVPGAKIEITNRATKITRGSTSDADGAFQFSGVEKGSYKITIEAAGFENYKNNNFAVEGNQSINVEVVVLFSKQSTTVGLLGY